jgi:hypothetical protein
VLDLGVTIPGFDLPHAIYLDAIDVNVRVVLRQRLLQHVWLSLPWPLFFVSLLSP